MKTQTTSLEKLLTNKEGRETQFEPEIGPSSKLHTLDQTLQLRS